MAAPYRWLFRPVNGTVGTVPTWRPSIPWTSDRSLFRLLVQAMADDVVAGRLRPGVRLPSHRDLAASLGVARGTVARAYREAQKLGMIQSEAGGGTRVTD